MTFEQFQATRTWFADLSRATIESSYFEDYENAPGGNVYVEGLYIECFDDSWLLIIANQQFVGADIEPLERTLYDFAVAEGIIGTWSA